jgi:TetR/AcrR family transcriptional regulator, transcriptional repressor for nem operon
MQLPTMNSKEPPEKKRKLVEATVKLMLARGYVGTTVEDICAAAGVTKGSFFHYFAGKEQICLAAMEGWSLGWKQIVEAARLDEIADPLGRVYALFEVMANVYTAPQIGVGCLVGTIAQEMAVPNALFRAECRDHFGAWVDGTARLLADAKTAHPPVRDFDPDALAWWLQSMVQGTMLIAKTRTDEAFILNNIAHCRAYIESLFGTAT